MKRKLLLLLELSSFFFFDIFISWTESKNVTIIKVPHKKDSKWVWSWTGQWKKLDDGVVGKVVYYYACDVRSQQNRWIRSDVFLVGDARRIDVTVYYSVSDCSSRSLDKCKQSIPLFIYKTYTQHGTTNNSIPEPWKKPEVYQLFGTTSPTNLTTGSLSRAKTNTETYSFATNSTTPYHYLAIQYQGGCFGLYSVTIGYSVCSSLALPSSLIQLPQTIAPENGSIQVSGSCAAKAQPMANNITLYGHCNANGEWSSNVTSGECWCDAGYGKYLNGSGAYCNECPSGWYQDKASGKACKPCPLNSVHDVDRRKCNCDPSFYRTKYESISDNCTGQPSAPPNISYSFVNASFVVLNWTTPLDLGRRSDVYYEVDCNNCNSEGKTCSMDCTGAVITHTPRTSRKATVQHLSAYTYYQFKVFAKNGVSHLAEKNGEKPKYAVGLIRTGESVPGAPVLKIIVLNSTSVVLSWTLRESNGVIINYQVSYYPVGEETKKTVLNTTKISITITGLTKETKYSFQVRGSTKVGLGRAGNVTQMVAMPSSNGRNNGNVTGLSQEQFVGIIVGVVVLILLLVIIILAAYLYRRNQRSRSMSKSYLTTDWSTQTVQDQIEKQDGYVKSQGMMNTFFPLLVPVLLVIIFTTSTEGENETFLKVPLKTGSSWIWSWTGGWTKHDGEVYYTACDVSSPQNRWIRSNKFLVGNASRIDVTVQYSVSDCSSGSLVNCKQNLKLFVYKTAIRHQATGGSNPIPDPSVKVYQLFGTTSPTNLTTGSLSRNNANTETYSFVTNSTTPYHYLAIQYQGGCFALYSFTISFSVCPSLALPSGLIQLPRTMAPANGSIQVSGSCAANAQPLANNITLYGDCNANGKWSSHVISGECSCNAGYGKYLNGSGAHCKECPTGSYQNTASGKACKPCPLNSVQDVDRRKCNCAPSFYRTKNPSLFDNCTGQPSAPRAINYTFVNASFVALEWTTPLDIGGRSDVYYEVECSKCNNDGKNCSMDCTGAVITHTTRTSRKATVQHLSTYTYYQFKVFARNGVSHLAEKNGEKPKYAVGLIRTGEGKPGVPVLTARVLNATTMLLSWTVQEPNGEILYVQVIYYQVGEEFNKTILNTTGSNITISGLINGKDYIFKVRARTSAGFGQPGNITFTKVVPMKNTSIKIVQSGFSREIIMAICLPLLLLLVCFGVAVAVCHYRRKRGKKPANIIPMNSERLFIDPSNYNSPLEAMRMHTQEIDVSNLELKINIGEGEFADVYQAVMISGSKREVVAVKMLKPTSSTKTKKNFILEASIMGQFKHPNVIELKGVVTCSPDTPMMIITEFMENGSLEHFLTSRNGMLTSLQLVGMARGVADGMAYLSKINFIHRDLAARNILVAENMASKISDFGLSRALDENNSIYLTQGGKIPVRWTAPEAIRYRKFSSASDVWSFGILLWEIMAFAERPYWDWDNEKVFQRVEEGFRLPPPMNCPKSIHDLMLDCWDKDMNNRKKFPDIVKRLDELIRSPDKMNDQSLRFTTSNDGQTNLGVVTSVEEWLIQINMRQYTDNFVDNGFVDMEQVISLLDDDGLKRLGVTLIGHRNKMNKSIIELKKHHKGPRRKQEFEIII